MQANTVFWAFTGFHSHRITPESEKQILIDLEFISSVSKSEKINVQGRFLQPNGLISSLSRTFWRPDNKENTLGFCENTIEKSITCLKLKEVDLNKHQKDSEEYNKILSRIKELIKLLGKSIKGLKNLQDTYSSHKIFTSTIDYIISRIREEIEFRIYNYFTEDEIKMTLTKEILTQTDN